MTLDAQLVAQARTVIARLELVSHGKTASWSPSHGTEPPALPAGGISLLDDIEDDHPQKSHIYFARMLRRCRTNEHVERLIREAHIALDAWQRTPQTNDPDWGSFAWKKQIARDDRPLEVVARFYSIGKSTVSKYRALYRTENRAA